jgi:hypothetical protein
MWEYNQKQAEHRVAQLHAAADDPYYRFKKKFNKYDVSDIKGAHHSTKPFSDYWLEKIDVLWKRLQNDPKPPGWKKPRKSKPKQPPTAPDIEDLMKDL